MTETLFIVMNYGGCEECCFQFSLPKASTNNPNAGFFQKVEALLLSNLVIENKNFLFQKGYLLMKTELIDLLCEKSFRYTDEPSFKLVSGRMSRFYVNCKPTTLSARGLFLVGNLVFEAIGDASSVTAVGGLTFGADPIAVATAFVSGLKGYPINAFSIRKTQKDHGIIKWIEGDVVPGQKVAVIDDVATTGGSTINAIERSRDQGLDVVKVVILVDRQEGGVDNIKKHVDDVQAVITRDELLARAQMR